MTQPWKAEVSVSAELARSLIDTQFPELRPVRVEWLGEGWDDVVYRVNGVWAFHFPRRQLGADIVATETDLLGRLPPLPLDTPRTRFRGQPEDRFRWPFAGYQCLEGSTWCRADVPLGLRADAAPQLGRFLRQLHALSADNDLLGMLPDDQLLRLDVGKRRAQAEDYLSRAIDHQLLGGQAVARWLDRHAGSLPTPRGDTLVHGDLYSRHLIVDAQHQLTGVIDWGDAHRGDPAIDLAIAHLVLPVDTHDAFHAAYGPVSPATWRLAKFRATVHSLITLVFGHQTNDAALVRESLRGLTFMHG